jgi:hypothetical protein
MPELTRLFLANISGEEIFLSRRERWSMSDVPLYGGCAAHCGETPNSPPTAAPM